MWTREFQRLGRDYERAKLVLFTDAVRSGCGFAEAAMGPFYCPTDGKVYVDLGFYRVLKQRFGAPGDFAQAYVIAHEVERHVQNLLGISRRVRQEQDASPERAMPCPSGWIQADCLAGMWTRSTTDRDLLEEGDVEEGRPPPPLWATTASSSAARVGSIPSDGLTVRRSSGSPGSSAVSPARVSPIAIPSARLCPARTRSVSAGPPVHLADRSP